MTWGVCDRGREARWPLMPPRAIADVLHPTIGHSLHQACTNTNRQSGCTSKPTKRLHLAKPVPFPEYAIPVCCWQSQAIEGKAVQCQPASMRVVKAAKQRGLVKSLEGTCQSASAPQTESNPEGAHELPERVLHVNTHG